MNSQRLKLLKAVSLIFLLPGLAGLITSAMISTYYLDTLPKMPIPAEMRMAPRNIHGTVVYQTDAEDLRLTVIEDISVCVFLTGLGFSLVYLRKWGVANALGAEEDEMPEEA